MRRWFLAALLLVLTACTNLPRILTSERPLDFSRFLDACRQAQERAASDIVQSIRERDYSTVAEREQRRWSRLTYRASCAPPPPLLLSSRCF